MKKIAFILCTILTIQLLFAGMSFAATVGESYISSQGACVMDFETGEILYQHNGDVGRVPASMTKIMNVYCIYEALKKGEITLDTVVPISANVYSKSRNSIYQSVLPLYYNQTYTVDEMLDVIIVYSASGAAVAMAELIGGSEDAFVERMNKKAEEMGIYARYYDSCGIASNMISPIGMAHLARNIIRDYPDILLRSSKKSVAFHGGVYKTTNHLLDTYHYDGADGLKTGTTAAAGYCFCGTATRGGRRMISVTMSSASTGQRFTDTARLLDYGFSVMASRYDSVYFTDKRTFINGSEIPTFEYEGAKNGGVIVAEDLRNYGFDVTFLPNTEILEIKYNPKKIVTPMSLEYYQGKKGIKAYSVFANSNISVKVDDGASCHIMKDAYSVNGYMCISVDELGSLFELSRDENTDVAYINASLRAPEPILPNGEKLTSGSAYIMDYETGEELYSFDGDTQKPVASIAKMMSVYVIYDAIKNGEIDFDTVVPISENVYNLSRVEDYKMMVNLEYDEDYTVDEMIDMIIIDSAAACVTAVAELICGSETEFVKRMNDKAEDIRIESVFYNGTGVCLNPETDKENLMSAKEVAIMTQKMINDYPEVLERTKRASVDFHGKTYYNLNKMFTDYYYEGADGFKNGMTNASGYCMCGTAIRDGRRVITVTLPSDSNEARFTDTAKMFDYGFASLGVDLAQTQASPSEKIFDENEEIKINIDGNYEMTYPDQKPVVIDGKAFVPVRVLMETLGKEVAWDEQSLCAYIKDEVTTLKLSAYSDVMVKDTTNPVTGEKTTEQVPLDAKPIIINGRILIPIRQVVESFGAAVIWDEDAKTILIIAGVC